MKSNSRGALIVIEGKDFHFKSSCAEFLLQQTKDNDIKAELFRFYDPYSPIGSSVIEYFEGSEAVPENKIVPMLKTFRPKMVELLNSGVSLIVDRYIYSQEVLISANKTLGVCWARPLDMEFIKPDLVIFLDTPCDAYYVEERYLSTDFLSAYKKAQILLFKNNWVVVDVNRGSEEVQEELRNLIENTVNYVSHSARSKKLPHRVFDNLYFFPTAFKSLLIKLRKLFFWFLIYFFIMSFIR